MAFNKSIKQPDDQSNVYRKGNRPQTPSAETKQSKKPGTPKAPAPKRRKEI